MKNTITNRQIVCEELMSAAESDPDIVVVCSDSRGSASLSAFADAFPKQFVEVGIAEQNLVSVSAGMASCGKRVFAASPASFLSTRSYEQVKVDVAYSGENVKLLGISGGVSYGALGMTHHSCQDIAAMTSLPGMRVYFPSDRYLTSRLMK
ncbi:MAG: transketolase family protein, partial [Lachnospiraceae bacterium]|nr:transketolase family protein [Lachnospiraceae bacterium]